MLFFEKLTFNKVIFMQGLDNMKLLCYTSYIVTSLHRYIVTSLHRYIVTSLHRYIVTSLHRYIVTIY